MRRAVAVSLAAIGVVAMSAFFGLRALEQRLTFHPMASSMLPWLPRWLHFVGRNRFESARKLASIHSPVLIAHGEADSTIPAAQARALYASANDPKRLVLVPGADHNVAGFAGREYIVSLSRFMKSVLGNPN